MGEKLEGRVELLGGMAFRASAGDAAIVVDAAPGAGGTGRGPLPMELFLLGLGGCTGMDVISILRKMRQEVTAYEVRVTGERATEHPRVFAAIRVEHVFRGRDLSLAAVRRAIELSGTRYCPAVAMLGKTARIEETFRIREELTGSEIAGTVAPGEAA
jgi:putative redox protein